MSQSALHQVFDPICRPLVFDPQTLRNISHWLNSIALLAPEAPVFLVGTHKDELWNTWQTITFRGEKYKAEKLAQAQQILADYLPKMFVARETKIVRNIQRPSDKEWFFAVDNKSRDPDGKCSDPVVHTLRERLLGVMMNDQRKVQGL